MQFVDPWMAPCRREIVWMAVKELVRRNYVLVWTVIELEGIFQYTS